MYSITVRNNILIAHSLPGEVFGPAQNMHGATYIVDAEFYAKEVNKPVLLDFTGHGCVNCRDIEARVWPDQRVRDILNNDYVLVSLYVDDKTILSEDYLSH